METTSFRLGIMLRRFVLVNVVDVAAFVLQCQKRTSTMKLHKLCFYSQALSLVKYGCPLFTAEFQAWKNGPVVPELFELHRGKFWIRDGELAGLGFPDRLSERDKDLIAHVCESLGKLTGGQLSERISNEDPWVAARGDAAAGEHCTNVITVAAMKDYYRASDIV